MKVLFTKEGEKLGYESAAHKNKYVFQDYSFDEGEWIYDFIWYEMSGFDDEIMTSVPLVLESELSLKYYGNLKTDFDKLLIAKDSTKVFVTTSHDLERKSDYI